MFSHLQIVPANQRSDVFCTLHILQTKPKMYRQATILPSEWWDFSWKNNYYLLQPAVFQLVYTALSKATAASLRWPIIQMPRMGFDISPEFQTCTTDTDCIACQPRIIKVYVCSSTDERIPVIIYKTPRICKSLNQRSVVMPKKPNYT